MTSLTIQLSDENVQRGQAVAAKHGRNWKSFVTESVTMVVTETERMDALGERAERVSQEEFEAVLRKVPHNPPDPGDEW